MFHISKSKWSVVLGVALIILAACVNPSPVPAPTLTASPTVTVISPDILTIAVDSGNPPFMYTDASGKAAGLYPYLLDAVFERMAVEVAIVAYPWKRTLRLGEEGVAGVGGIYKTAERLQIYDYSAPLYTEQLVLYVRKGESFAFNNVADLADKVVGVILGWSYGDEFDAARQAGLFSVDEVPTDQTNFEKLVRGRVDCVIAIDIAADQLIRELEYEEQLEKLAQPVAVNATYLVFAKSLQREALLAQFDATLAAMQADGSYAKIIADFTSP